MTRAERIVEEMKPLPILETDFLLALELHLFKIWSNSLLAKTFQLQLLRQGVRLRDVCSAEEIDKGSVKEVLTEARSSHQRDNSRRHHLRSKMPIWIMFNKKSK